MMGFRNKPKFEIFRSDINNQFYWRLVASNGKIIAQSEGYKRVRSAIAGANAVRRAVSEAQIDVV